MKDPVIYDPRGAEFQSQVAAGFEELKKLKAAGKREAFNEKLLGLLPDVKRYITRGLRLALAKGVISHNKYRPDDFFDQLFLDVYDRLDEVPDKNAFHAWLFGRAETQLEEMEVKEIFDTFLFDNLDDYSRAERAEMDESFSTDGDGDLVMMDELDDISYKGRQTLLRNIFLDDGHEDLMALMESTGGQKQVERHLDNVLFELSPNLRSVFELACEQGFGPVEIARIKHMEPQQVNSLLEKARRQLRETLSERIFDT
jgi:RNA polymerase sigma factor (sigma-70 family)